jgi:glycosyltransferase involved in cell wall biosynthesis
VIDISVIICTRNRAGVLGNSLQAIDTAAAEFSADLLEVILVDNGSTDGTPRVAAQWASQTKIRHQIVVEARKGLSVARNTGVSRAQGRIIVFTDDDCVVSPTYFSEVKAHFDADGGPAIRGGKVELGRMGDLPLSIKVEDARMRLHDLVHPGAFVLGCNMAMSAEVPNMIGGFDEEFGAGAPLKSGEDTEYLFRAYCAGILVEYVPDMIVRHHHGRTETAAGHELHRGYDLGTGALYAKYLFRRPRLLKFLYWTARSYTREYAGGPKFSEELGISHGAVLKANLRGFLLFWLLKAKSTVDRRAHLDATHPHKAGPAA